MYKKNRNGFTLVELIVVITILAILGTIAFISLQGYSKSARDSKRLSDIDNFKTTVELYQVNQGRYPDPDNAGDITYSGSVVRSQGTVGESVVRQLKGLPSIPYDPLTEVEYTYSVLNNKKEYQVGTIFEADLLLGYFFNQTNAIDKQKALAHIAGTYNGVAAKVSTGSTTFVLSVPSIISTEIGDLLDIIQNKKLVYNNFNNLPSSFQNTQFDIEGGFNFIPNKFILYDGDLEDLKINQQERIDLISNIKDSYSGTILDNGGELSEILSLDVNPSAPSNIAINYSVNLINKVLKSNIPQSEISNPTIIGNYWPQMITGVNNSSIRGIDVDSSGNIYVTGIFSGEITMFGNIYNSVGGTNLFLAKLDKNGSLKWIKISTGSVSANVYDSIVIKNGYLYVTGYMSGTSNIFGQELTSNGSNDIFVSKLDLNGNLVWSISSGGTGSDVGQGIAVDNNGNIYVTGYFTGTSTIFGTELLTVNSSHINLFLSKLDSSGTPIWSKGSTSSNVILYNMGNSIGLDSEGNIYILYNFSQTITFLGQSYSIGAARDSAIMKISSEGNFIWVKRMNAGGNSTAMDLDINNDNIYITGRTKGDKILGITFTKNGDQDIFFSKLDTEGTVLWSKNSGGAGFDGGYSLAVDSDGNSYISGKFNGTINSEGQNLTSIGLADLFVYKMDTNGNYVWHKRAGSTASEESYGIAVDSNNNNIYVAGYIGGNGDLYGKTVTGVMGSDGFITKVENE